MTTHPSSRPPRLARLLLTTLIRGRGAEGATGDLYEGFARRAAQSTRGARGWFTRQAVSLVVAWWSPRMRRARRRNGTPATVGQPLTRRMEGMREVGRDMTYAVRSLSSRPAIPVVVVATLALGIGANAAIFSFIDGILLRQLPYPDPERIVFVHATDEERGDRYLDFAFAEVMDLQAGLTTLDRVAAFSMARQAVGADGFRPAVQPFARVSQGFFDVLGTAPRYGRGFTDEEYREGSPVAVLSYGLWATVFGADERVVGRTMTLGERPFTVVGVMPPEFRLPEDARFWRPMSQGLRNDDDREMSIIGHLAPGASVAGANAELQVVGQVRSSQGAPADAARGAWVEPANRTLVRSVRQPLQLLMISAGLVLLIACVNIVSLLLARGESRRHEIAIRVALGAGRRRIVRQLLTESVLLAVLGAGLGVVIGRAMLPVLIELSPDGTPRLHNVTFDGGVIGVMMILGLGTSLVFGLLPALRASRTAPSGSLAQTGTRSAGSRSTQRLQATLIVAELAMATVLIFGAGLFASTYRHLTDFDRGFDIRDVLVIPLEPTDAVQQSEGGIATFFTGVLETARATPGVTTAALGYHSADEGRGINLRLLAPSGLSEAPDARGSMKTVTSGYFATAGIDLVDGRVIDERDREGTSAVAVVNESFARIYLRDRAPIGATFTRGSPDPNAPIRVEVVGLVKDISPDPGEPPLPIVYLPHEQLTISYMELVVRHAGDPTAIIAALRERIWTLDPAIALNEARTVASAVEHDLASPRFHMIVVGLFGGLALLVACVGVYGLLSFSVSSRHREIGVRRALGAEARSVVLMVVTRGGRLAVLGVGLGLIAAALGGRLVRALLFGVAPLEPTVVASTVFLLLLTAALGSLAPALRAARVSPLSALRESGGE